MQTIIDSEQTAALRALVSNAQHIVICTHTGPDGDAVGSSLAIRHWMKRWGKDARVVVPNRFPDFLMWMPEADTILRTDRDTEAVKELVAQADLFFIADLCAPSRMMELEPLVMANPAPKVMIDHHLDPESFCQITISRPEMCATCEVLCHLLSDLGELDTISRPEAVCLYTGMMTDTGAFTYASTRPDVYECVYHLLGRGIDKDHIYRQVFWTASPNRMKLMGYMLYVKMELMHKKRASLMTLTNDERHRFGIKQGDTEGFVNLPLQILGMRVSVFLSEDTEHEGRIKVSLRSVDDFPCNEMAAEFFNGGGHKNASGGHLMMTMDEAVKVVHRAVEAYGSWLAK
ncbi:MAG: DHH family phosphoesterase [Bacteroidaceae bacterium]|nr:DHH family phosphoesterase [Bacteroidaceae bacterium]